MVKLNKIYTKTGDKGKTGLGDGRRVNKFDLRVECYGTIEEANSILGIARCYTRGSIDKFLSEIQNDLFDLGADLCMPQTKAKKSVLRITDRQIKRMEIEIDKMNSGLKPLNSFVLPGGTLVSSYLHLARTIIRRSERITVALMVKEKINPNVIIYLNRLSDYIFMLSRYLNARGKKDILWRPGKNC